MNHFLDIRSFTKVDIEHFVERAMHFKNTSAYPCYSNTYLANLFYENSTRTRVSFELAAKHLGISVTNLDLQTSSEQKGEEIEDTIQTLSAMGISLFVIRHKQNGLPHAIAQTVPDGIHIVNAGDGQQAHPSQALLDWMTIFEQKPHTSKLKIALVGDVLHSRVANSFQTLCAIMGVGELRLVAPKMWQPKTVQYGTLTESLDEGIDGADVVICLRIQKERLTENECLNLDDYRHHYLLNETRLSRAKSDAMVMHPGPMNRGVEIDSQVADGPQSFIRSQVQNGVFMRMAILEALCR